MAQLMQVTEVIWIRQLLGGLGFLVKALDAIYCENKSAIQVVDNLIAHSKMKHVKLHAHYLRKLVQEKVVSLLY